MIDPTDRGFTLGDGLFETLLWAGGELHEFALHLDRMTAGCAVLGLPAPDPGEAESLMRRALAEADLGDARAAVRLTLTAGSGGRGLERPEPVRPALVATAAVAPKPGGPARVIISQVRRNEGSPAASLKSLSYLDNVLARRDARAVGADEALMLNGRGELACGAASNLFWISDGRLLTPTLACGVLPGIVRGRVIEAARALGIVVEEVAIGASALAHAEGIFLTNSLIGLRPVVGLENNPAPQSRLADEISGRLGIP